MEKKILIVDDERDIIRILYSLFRPVLNKPKSC